MLKTIVVVNDFAHINGGAGQVALASAIALAKKGYKVVVFSAVAPAMPSLIEAGVEVVIMGQHEILNDPNRLRAAIQGIWNRKAGEKMGELLESLDPAKTVVHFHSWTKSLSSSVVQAAIRRGFAVVCTLHDYFSACPNGGFFDFQRSEICTKKPLSLECVSKNCDVRSYPQKLWRVARHAVQKKVGLVPDGIRHFITVSDFSEAILRPFLWQGAVLHRVDNPTNTERRECIDAGANDAFVFVGRLSPEKGVNLFASASNKLGVTPLFVGEGPCGESIKKICPGARITGWVSGAQVAEYLSSARALILPSLLYEVSPLVIAEASALGIPSIVPDTCAARDVVENERTGLWFRGGDEYDLAEKMRSLLQRDIAATLGRASYEKYWENPCMMDRHIQQLEGCYAHVLADNALTSRQT